jgi:hypothetical protein
MRCGEGSDGSTAATSGIGAEIPLNALANELISRSANWSSPRVVTKRYAILLAVVLLCAASYFAGIWTGYGVHQTRCITESPGVLVCGTNIPATPSGTEPRPGSPERGDF